MKHWKILILVVVLLFLPKHIYSQENLIQNFEEGILNWTDMTITVTGIGMPNPELSPAQYRLSALRFAREDAAKRVLEIIKRINLTAELKIGKLIDESETIRAQIETLIDDLRVIGKPRRMPDSTVELDVEFYLFVEFLNIVLPSSGVKFAEFISKELSDVDTSSKKQVLSYTGLIVDCRGLQLDYALAPKILDEKGLEYYGPGWVNRKIATSVGIVQYVKSEVEANIRVGENPARLKGLQTTGVDKCDIIIANADALVLFSKNNLNFLNMCKVAFLIE